jgi:glycosyltransferase involved in cell wall biosynthesis
MSKPTVSIIIPVYNRANLIGRCIRSVLEQTYSDFELIVVDDGSTDNTAEMIRRFSDRRIEILTVPENRGAQFARNMGIQHAVGKYIAFQDSDDEWTNNKLDKQVEVLDKAGPEVGLVYSGYWNVRGNSRVYLPSPATRPKEGDLHKILLMGNFITTQTVLLKAECLARAGLFDERLTRLQDWELWLRISHYYLFRFIDEPLVISYFQSESITADEEKLVKSFEMILEKHAHDFNRDRKALAHIYYFIGTHLLYSAQAPSKESVYLRRALCFDPANFKHLLYAVVTLFGRRPFDTTRMIYRRLKGLLK